MAKYILTVTLNPALDRTVSVEFLTAGRDISTTVDWAIAGGKGINVARVLTRLGHKAFATGLLGGSSGEVIKSFIKGEKIPFSFVPVKSDTRVHTTVREASTGNITRLLERGMPVTGEEYKAFKLHYAKLLMNASFVILSGSLPPGVKDDAYRELIEMAHAKGVDCALDSSGAALREGLKAVPEVIKPNYDELIALLGEKRGIRVDKPIFNRLKGYCSRYCLVTLGDKGAWVSDFNEVFHISHSPVKGRNHVGCGDAFLGGFISALMRGKNIEDCSRLACVCSIANLYAPYTGAI